MAIEATTEATLGAEAAEAGAEVEVDKVVMPEMIMAKGRAKARNKGEEIRCKRQ